MNKLVGSLFAIVLTLFLIMMFNYMAEDYDKVILLESFTAEENTSVEEEFIVSQKVYEVLEIHVEGYHVDVETVVVSINVLGDGSIILCDNCSGIGDEVIIEYNYVTHGAEYHGALIDVIPFIMSVLLVGAIGYMLVKWRN